LDRSLKNKKMKKLIIISLCLVGQLMYAQTPSAFSYQGMLLNEDGYGIDNKTADFIITISETNSSVNIYYQELQEVTTDQNGVFNINIGEGTSLQGTMDDVDWLASVPFIEVEYDLSDGQGSQSLGYTQFNSVPFCFHSKYVVCQQGPQGFPGQNGPAGPVGPVGPPAPSGQSPQGAQGPPGLPITEMLNATPAGSVEGTVYLDDGTNTEDGTPGFRYFDGTEWIQL